MDDNGTIAWRKSAGEVDPGTIPIIVPDPAGGLLVAGEIAGAPGTVTTVRFDDQGAPVWNTTVGGSSGERYLLSAARQDPTSGYHLLAGVTGSRSTEVLEVSLGEDGSIFRQETVNASAPVTWVPDGGYLSAALAENDYGGALLRVDRFDEGGAAITLCPDLSVPGTILSSLERLCGRFWGAPPECFPSPVSRDPASGHSWTAAPLSGHRRLMLFPR